jgi:hypothetical protein
MLDVIDWTQMTQMNTDFFLFSKMKDPCPSFPAFQ